MEIRIALDCRMLNCSGIGTFLKGVLPDIINSNHIFPLLIGDASLLSKYKRYNPSIRIYHTQIPPFSIEELFRFPINEVNKCDVFFTPNYNIPAGIRIPVFSTIHDVLFLDKPHLTSGLGYLIRKLAILWAIKKSELIFTVSDFSKSRIIANSNTSKPIVVCYNGADNIMQNIKLASRPIKEEYYLYIGNIKPHKGLNVLLDAFNILKSNGKKLVIVGNQDSFRTGDTHVLNRIESLTKNGDIIFTGFIPQEQLNAYLQYAYCLIQPSTYEGFGLPPLEAMQLGTPVILSDIPVFKELYSDFPVTFFSSEDYKELAKKMSLKLSRIKLSDELHKRYSYRKTASTILSTIKEYI